MRETSKDPVGLDSLNTEALEFNAINHLIIGKELHRSGVLELCSPVRMNVVAAKFGLVPGMSLDWTNGYNFDEMKDQDRSYPKN